MRERLLAAMEVLRGVRDVLEERVDEGVPSWCARRGWTEALAAMSDAELAVCEAEGLVSRAGRVEGLPRSLVELAAAIEEATRLPELASGAIEAGNQGVIEDARSIRARKVPQLAALIGAVDAMARGARRIVDVGSGSGHFTHLAAEVFERETLGIERNPERVAAAAARSRERGRATESATATATESAAANTESATANTESAGLRERGRSATANTESATATIMNAATGARFVNVDASKQGLALEAEDLAVGLHACGALGDRIAREAAIAGCDVALVSCCLQKIEGPEREALSRAAEGLALRKETLGLSNLTSQARGVEATIVATMAARQARHALSRLLRARGVDVAPGEEMRGINRRRAHKGLGAIAEQACKARGIDRPTSAEIAFHEQEAAISFGRIRRLSLPRNMLSRLVEVIVVLDRAAILEESGHFVRVATVFSREVTPRNIGIFASRDRRRLPATL